MLWTFLYFGLVFGQGKSFQAASSDILYPERLQQLAALSPFEGRTFYSAADRRYLDEHPTPAPTTPPKWERLYTGLMCLTGSAEVKYECSQVSQSQINAYGVISSPAHLAVCENWASSQNLTFLLIHSNSKVCCGITECTLQSLIDAPGWSVYAFTSLKFCGTLTNNNPTSLDHMELTGQITMKGPTSNNSCVTSSRIQTSSTRDDVDYVCPKKEFMVKPFEFYIDIPCGEDGEYQAIPRECQPVFLDRLTHPFFPWGARFPAQFFMFFVVFFHKYFYYVTHCECRRRRKRKFKTPELREEYETSVHKWQNWMAFIMVCVIVFQIIWDFFFIYGMEWFDWALFFTQRPPFQLFVTYYFIYPEGLTMILSVLSYPVRPILRLLAQESGEPPYVGFTVEVNDKNGEPKDPVRLEREKKVGMKWANRKKMLSYFFACLFFMLFMWSTFMIFLFIVFGGIFYIWVHLILLTGFNAAIPALMYINKRYICNEKENQWFQYKVPVEIRQNWGKLRWYIQVKFLFNGAYEYYFSLGIVQFFYIWQIWFLYTSMHILGFWVYRGLYETVGYTDGVTMLLSAPQWDQLYARSCEHTYVIGLQLVGQQPECAPPPWKLNSCDF